MCGKNAGVTYARFNGKKVDGICDRLLVNAHWAQKDIALLFSLQYFIDGIFIKCCMSYIRWVL